MSIPTYEGLLDSARFFADRALQGYTTGENHAVLMDAGTLVEHISKAFLARENPAYLAELKNGGFDHLLHLTGRGDRAPRVSAVRTIGAYEAVTRVQRLLEINTDKAELDQLLHVRNGIVHAGDGGTPRTRQLLTKGLRYCDEVYNALGVGERWGEHVDLVVALVDQNWDDIQHEYHRKVTAARASLRALMDQIPESQQADVAAFRQSTLAVLDHQEWPGVSGEPVVGLLVDCPVCRHFGAICAGPLRAEYELVKTGRLDMAEDLEVIELWIEPEYLKCQVCTVALESTDEMKLAGFPPRLEVNGHIRRFFSAPNLMPTGFYDEGPWTVD